MEKEMKDKFKLNLQLHAEEDPEETPPAEDGKKEGEEEKGKTFTQEELDGIIKKRLARDRSKWEEEYEARLEEEKEEAEELAKLSEKERQKVILDKEKAKFEEERKAFKREKIELQVAKELAEKELPVTFSKLLVAENAEASLENINNFEKEWQKALEKAVDERIKGTSPRKPESTIISKHQEDFMKLADEASIRK